MHLKEYEDLDWIHGSNILDFVNTIINLRFLQNVRNYFLTDWATISFWRALLRKSGGQRGAEHWARRLGDETKKKVSDGSWRFLCRRNIQTLACSTSGYWGRRRLFSSRSLRLWGCIFQCLNMLTIVPNNCTFRNNSRAYTGIISFTTCIGHSPRFLFTDQERLSSSKLDRLFASEMYRPPRSEKRPASLAWGLGTAPWNSIPTGDLKDLLPYKTPNLHILLLTCSSVSHTALKWKTPNNCE